MLFLSFFSPAIGKTSSKRAKTMPEGALSRIGTAGDEHVRGKVHPL
jgi:hypothetical protein